MKNCTACGVEIPANRLAAKPSAKLCLACQTKDEDTKPTQQQPRAYVHPDAAMLHSIHQGGLGLGVLIDTVNDAYEKSKGQE